MTPSSATLLPDEHSFCKCSAPRKEEARLAVLSAAALRSESHNSSWQQHPDQRRSRQTIPILLQSDHSAFEEVPYGGIWGNKWRPCTGGESIGKYIECLRFPMSYRSLSIRWNNIGRPRLRGLRTPLNVLFTTKATKYDLASISDAQEATIANSLRTSSIGYSEPSKSAKLFVSFASHLDIYCAVHSELTSLEQGLEGQQQFAVYTQIWKELLKEFEQDRAICNKSYPHRCILSLLWGEVTTWSTEEIYSRFLAYIKRSATAADFCKAPATTDQISATLDRSPPKTISLTIDSLQRRQSNVGLLNSTLSLPTFSWLDTTHSDLANETDVPYLSADETSVAGESSNLTSLADEDTPIPIGSGTFVTRSSIGTPEILHSAQQSDGLCAEEGRSPLSCSKIRQHLNYHDCSQVDQDSFMPLPSLYPLSRHSDRVVQRKSILPHSEDICRSQGLDQVHHGASLDLPQHQHRFGSHSACDALCSNLPTSMFDLDSHMHRADVNLRHQHLSKRKRREYCNSTDYDNISADDSEHGGKHSIKASKNFTDDGPISNRARMRNQYQSMLEDAARQLEASARLLTQHSRDLNEERRANSISRVAFSRQQ